MENQSYKNENDEKKYLNIMRRNQFLKVKNSLLELEKDFIELKDIELKDREVNINNWVKIFKSFKPIIVSLDDIDRFEEEAMKKIRRIKNTSYDWLINYIAKPIRKSVSILKDKFINLFKVKTPKQTVYVRGQKLSQLRKQNIKKPFLSEENKEKMKDRIITDIWKLFETEEEKEERKESEKKKKKTKE